MLKDVHKTEQKQHSRNRTETYTNLDVLLMPQLSELVQGKIMEDS